MYYVLFFCKKTIKTSARKKTCKNLATTKQNQNKRNDNALVVVNAVCGTVLDNEKTNRKKKTMLCAVSLIEAKFRQNFKLRNNNNNDTNTKDPLTTTSKNSRKNKNKNKRVNCACCTAKWYTFFIKKMYIK